MAEITEIITTSIVVQDAAVSQQGFGTPLIMTHENFFGPNLVQSFTTTAAMVTAGADASGPTVLAAGAVFSQQPSPPLVKIGRRSSTPVTMTKVVTVEAAPPVDTIFTTTINGTGFTFDSGATPTPASVALGLVAAINLGSEPVTALDNVDGTYDLTEDVDGVLFGLTLSPNTPDTLRHTQLETTADAGVAADYAAIKVEDNDFFGVISTSTGEVEINALSAAVESDSKIYLAQTADSNVLTDAAGNVAEDLDTSAPNRTALVFSEDHFDFASASWAGRLLPGIPGSSTWHLKSLASVTADDLGPTHIANVKSNNANVYTPMGGSNRTRNGTMSSGRFIDIQRGVDWLTARINEEIFGLLINNEKIKFTDEGLAQIQGKIEQVLRQGITNGLIVQSPEFSVFVPKASDISANDKALRQVTGITFSATLAGAAHTVTVNGTLTV